MDDGLSFASWSNRDMTFYQERLQSFKDWPKQLIPDKFSLAKAGFYYTGEHDKVQCFACSVELTRWERTDDPWLEHKKWSSQCVYLKITGCGEEKPCEHPMQISSSARQTTGFGAFSGFQTPKFGSQPTLPQSSGLFSNSLPQPNVKQF